MKPYGCSCGWSGSTLAGLVAHLGLAHDIYVTLPRQSPEEQRLIFEEGL